MNLSLAIVCFSNVVIQCFLALDNYGHLAAATGYTVALITCGIVQNKDQVIASQKAIIEDAINSLRAL